MKHHSQPRQKTKHQPPLLGIIVSLALLLAAGAFYFYQSRIKKQNQTILSQSTKARSEIDELKAQLKDLAGQKRDFIVHINKSSLTPDSQWVTNAEWMATISLEVQDDFDRFEALHAQTGNVLAEDISKFRNHERTRFVRSDVDIRQIESLDRKIDLARMALSKQTFRIEGQLKKLKKPLLAKKPQRDLPHFKIDHLILAKNRN